MITRRGVDVSVPLDERERFHQALLQSPPQSAVLLATCDRVEVYEGFGEPDAPTVRHLFRVVAGLESPLLGEHQIQGQVKRAYEQARVEQSLNAGLHRLFQQALRVGKRVRTETKLGQGALGHAQTVVKILQTLDTPLTKLRILVIGVNNLSKGILRFLTDAAPTTIFLGNRTLSRAEALVADLGRGQALTLDRLSEVLPRVDVVISATSAPHFIVREADVPTASGPRWYFDLAVPRDIEPALAQRPGVRLFNVSDIEIEAQKALRDRRAEVQQAEAIIDLEVEKFMLTKAVHVS